MTRPRSRRRHGFTLIELIVVIAILTLLVAILVPAVQKVRATSARIVCANNMKQVGAAIHTFHTTHNKLPTYNGLFPAVSRQPINSSSQYTGTLATTNRSGVYGGWFAHLIPYVEQQALYQQIATDVAKYGNGNSPAVMSPATGKLVSPAVAGYWDYTNAVLVTPAVPARLDYTNAVLVTPAVPATYNEWNAVKKAVPVTKLDKNGYQITEMVMQPAKFADPGTGIPAVYNPAPVTVPAKSAVYNPPAVLVPAKPAVYDPPHGGPVESYVGLWRAEVRATTFKILQCPSDPSVTTSPHVKQGLVYADDSRGAWGSTNYLANWNVFADPRYAAAGYTAPPPNLSDIQDGLSSTVMLGEAYAWCDDIGRVAMQPWFTNSNLTPAAINGTVPNGTNNFGLTYALSDHTLVLNASGSASATPVGFQNPSSNGLIFSPQIRPLPKPFAQCPSGRDCCNNLTVQSGHATLNVCMADGSVRTVASSISLDTWRRVLLPNDGPPGTDW